MRSRGCGLPSPSSCLRLSLRHPDRTCPRARARPQTARTASARGRAPCLASPWHPRSGVAAGGAATGG
eukprot:7973617-Lingulodinium_polyedra.AAC.1